ncbi:hypothetical protein Hanom_Chr11g01002951 [Helianthus anomalus]
MCRHSIHEAVLIRLWDMRVVDWIMDCHAGHDSRGDLLHWWGKIVDDNGGHGPHHIGWWIRLVDEGGMTCR